MTDLVSVPVPADGSRRTRVAVVFGGVSSEHGVSCLTAAVGLGITPTGRWAVLEPETIGRLQVSDGRLPELSENPSDAMLLRGESGSELAVRETGALTAL